MGREIYVSKIYNEKGEYIEFPFEFDLIFEERIQMLFDFKIMIDKTIKKLSVNNRSYFLENLEIIVTQFLYYLVKEEITQSTRNQFLEVLCQHMATKTENRYNDIKCFLLKKDIYRLSSEEFNSLFVAFLYDFIINVWSVFENGINELCEIFDEEIKKTLNNNNCKKQLKFLKRYIKDEEIMKILEEKEDEYIKKFPKYISLFDKINFIFKKIKEKYSREIKKDKEVLLFYSTLRNTIHNVGINKKETKKIEINGKKLEIKENSPAFFENYFDVLELIKEIFLIYIEIMRCLYELKDQK